MNVTELLDRYRRVDDLVKGLLDVCEELDALRVSLARRGVVIEDEEARAMVDRLTIAAAALIKLRKHIRDAIGQPSVTS